MERLRRFVPVAGRRYREERKYDRGVNRHHSVSGLSPYIRHRLLSETEVLTAVLAQHSRSTAEKFIQEVLWRGYWKGWLEQRPSVWADYLDDLGSAGSALATDADVAARYQAAVDGVTCHWLSSPRPSLGQQGYCSTGPSSLTIKPST